MEKARSVGSHPQGCLKPPTGMSWGGRAGSEGSHAHSIVSEGHCLPGEPRFSLQGLRSSLAESVTGGCSGWSVMYLRGRGRPRRSARELLALCP